MFLYGSYCIGSIFFHFNQHKIAEKSWNSFQMSERKISQDSPVIFVWTDQMYRKYKYRLGLVSEDFLLNQELAFAEPFGNGLDSFPRGSHNFS